VGWTKRTWLGIGVLYSSRLLGANYAITVHLYDYAGLSDTTLAKAERAVSRIYRHSGVEVSWMECATPDGQATKFKICEPESAGPAVSLSILPAVMEGRMRESAGLVGRGSVSGMAVGGHAYVFLQRVIEICGSRKYPEEVILGHLMAHEIGHVLLGDNSHSAEGMMSARFSSGDLRLALDGLLFFDSKQSVLMRDRLAAQVEARR
jgi:hypothetical protein